MRISKKSSVLPRVIPVCLVWVGIVSACLRLQAANPNPSITIQCTVIALPREQALRSIATRSLGFDVPAGIGELLTLVEDKRAESVAAPFITTKSGQHAVSETGTTKLEVEPVLGPAGDLIDVNIEFTYLGKKLSTAVMLKNGEAKLLGAFDAPEEKKNVTYFVVIMGRTAK